MTRFVLGIDPSAIAGGSDDDLADAVTHPLDRAVLAVLAELVDDATGAFERYDYARALERTEATFWTFCDDAVELVKGRAYGSLGPGAAASASAALRLSLSTLHRLLAPFLPFVTEEVWSWWRQGSVHHAPWPGAETLRRAAGDADPLVLSVASEALGQVRKAKTNAKRSLRTEVTSAVVRGRGEELEALRSALDDLSGSGHIAEVELVAHDVGPLAVDVVLAEPVA